MADATDYSQYGSWERITSKTGQSYYIVPGTGYVYDPFLSQAKGRPVLWVNPTAAVKEQEKAVKDAKDAQDNAAWGQVAGTAGGLAGTAGAAYLANSMYGGGAAASTAGTTAAGAGAGVAAPVAAAPAVIAAPVAAPVATSAGVSSAAGAGGASTAGAGGTTGVTTGLGSLGVGGALAGAAAAGLMANNWYEGGGKDILSGSARRDDWINSAFDVNPVTAPINFGLRTLGGTSIGKIAGGGGKSKSQKIRDQIRNSLQAQGVTDGKDLWQMADGSTMDFGLDGGSKVNIVDFENPLSARAVGWANPVAYLLAGGDKDQATWLAGRIANGAMANAKDEETVRLNIQKIANDLKMTPQSMQGGIDTLATAQEDGKQGIIDKDLAAAFKVGAASIFDAEMNKKIKPIGAVSPQVAGGVEANPAKAPGFDNSKAPDQSTNTTGKPPAQPLQGIVRGVPAGVDLGARGTFPGGNLGAAAAGGFMQLPMKVPDGQAPPAGIAPIPLPPVTPAAPQADPRYDAQGNWIGSPGMRSRPANMPVKRGAPF